MSNEHTRRLAPAFSSYTKAIQAANNLQKLTKVKKINLKIHKLCGFVGFIS